MKADGDGLERSRCNGFFLTGVLPRRRNLAQAGACAASILERMDGEFDE
jgi:hypothetical protein